MAFVKGTQLIDANGDILIDSLNRILLTPPYIGDEMPNILTRADIEKAVRAYINVPIFKIELVDKDEMPFEDISPFIISNSIKYSQSFQSGQTRSLSFDIVDNDGRYFPSHVGKIWHGTKVKISLGLLVEDDVIFYPKGIFVVKDATYKSRILSLQLVDKYGRLDGTISGTTEHEYKIVPGTPIMEAIKLLLLLDDGTGSPYDAKEVFFPLEHLEAKVPYTIRNNYESSIGDIIVELANIISCTVYYDDNGHLTLEAANEITDLSAKTVDWRYKDGECQFADTNVEIKFPNVYNKIMVVGSNINGYLCKYIATNNNPASPTSVGNSPVRFKYIEDSNIYSDELCKIRAEYELQTNTLLSVPISFKSIYIPFLSVNNLIEYTDDSIVYGFKGSKVFNGEKMLITAIDISGTDGFTISAKNIKELAFYG